MPSSTTRRAARTGAATAAVAIPLAAAYAFAVEYRRRAGFPKPRPLLATPDDDGLPWESLAIPSPGGALPAWFIPARGGAPGPGVVLVHGWESSRARMLPNAQFLHAAGFHTLLFDVRGHGENPPEVLPISGGEFGADAAAAVAVLHRRPEVTSVGLLGHSMGAVGAVLAAAREPGVAALAATAIPAHPRLLTRRTFELAGLQVPGPVALPLAWLTLHVYLRPAAIARGESTPFERSAPTRGRSSSFTGAPTTSFPSAMRSSWCKRPGCAPIARRSCSWSRAGGTAGSTSRRPTARELPPSSRPTSGGRTRPARQRCARRRWRLPVPPNEMTRR